MSRISGPASIALRAGLGLTAVLGVWLVIDFQGYSFLDGWIVATIVLWSITGALSGRLVVEQRATKALVTRLTAGGEEGRSAELQAALRRPAALTLRVAAAASAIAALALMIWKPGAG